MSKDLSNPAVLEINEVSPRDGLQAYPTGVSTTWKIELIQRAAAAGLRRIEVASFVDGRRVPQMADAEAVVRGTSAVKGLARAALVLNERGVERALSVGVEEINMVVVATETFSLRNQGLTVDQALSAWAKVAQRAHAAGVRVTVTLSAAFGCPYEGEIDPTTVVALADQVAASGPDEIVLADTIGAAVPAAVGDLVARVLSRTGLSVRCHFHDTRNTGIANVFAAIEAGSRSFDASLAGLGGCPFAPGASGNIATEDLAWCLARSGFQTGVDPVDALAVVSWIHDTLEGSDPGGALVRAGVFPTG